jgi:flagellar biosynthesis component FlhA
VLPLAPELEHLLRASALPPGPDGIAQFPFEVAERVALRLKAVLPTLEGVKRPVLLTATDLRAGLQRQLRALLPEATVLAHTEVDPGIPIRALGHLALIEETTPPAAPHAAQQPHLVPAT